MGPEAVRPELDTIVVFVPASSTGVVLDALFAAGAGQVGNYSECAFVVRGSGQFRPLAGANPALGEVGELHVVEEDRVEVVSPRARRAEVIAALRAAHPYEEPAFQVIAHAEQ